MTLLLDRPPVERLLHLLACPTCRAPLRPRRDRLHCAGCGEAFRVRHGRPVFLPEAEEVRVMPAEHLSNQPPAEVLDWLTWLDGLALNLGAGGTREKLENCIELEHAVFRHTDVVGDAHRLPFADGVFDAVVTFNTFEHLHDPVRAAAEVYRVLKPGGKLVLHTAFLQPVHEPPYHFYNTTEFGLRRWFGAFDISRLCVSDNFNPAYVLAWLSSEVVRAVERELGGEAARQLAASPLGFWQSTWEDPGLQDNPLWAVLRRLPEAAQRNFSAGFHLEATKPLAEEAGGDDPA
jgi:SAM-dependent methyltransferase